MKSQVIARACLAALVIILAMAGCGKDHYSGLGPDLGRSADLAASSNLVTLPFAAANFSNPKPNSYFPLVPGTTFTYHGVSKDGEERNVVDVTSETKSILGVTVTVVHDQVFIEDGSLLEDTFDWFAADNQGNVWYFGEDTREFDHDTLVTTEGSWEAGKNGARPGIIMLANPKVGNQFKQEDAPGVVEDMGKVVGLNETVTVPYGTFTHCLKTTEWTPIEPGNRSHKFYAPNVGFVLEVSTRQGGERVELVTVE